MVMMGPLRSLSGCSSMDQTLLKSGPWRRKRNVCPASRCKSPRSFTFLRSHVTHLDDHSPQLVSVWRCSLNKLFTIPHQGGWAELTLLSWSDSEGASDRSGLHLYGPNTSRSGSGSMSLDRDFSLRSFFCSC